MLEPSVEVLGICSWCATILVVVDCHPLKIREAELNDLIKLSPKTHRDLDRVQRMVRGNVYEMDKS